MLASGRTVHFENIKEISRPNDPMTPVDESEREGRLFRDIGDPGDGKYQEGEPIVPETGPAAVVTSPMLTIWRKVWVEVDSMGNVTTGDPNDDAADAHTPLTGDVPDPDTSAMADAYAPAFIQINVITDPSVSQSGLTFEAGFDTKGDTLIYAGNHRQTPEAADYWSVYLIGIYEYGGFEADLDNDPNSEFAWMGWTNVGANQVANGDNDFSFIAMEITADVADSWGWDAGQRDKIQQIVALHESGHQFELDHPDDNAQIYPGHAMTHPFSNATEAQAPQVQLAFSDDDIRKIRQELPTTGP